MTPEKITTHTKKAVHITENKKIKFTRNIQCNVLARRWLWLIPPPLDEALPQKQERMEWIPSPFPFWTPSRRYCGTLIESPFSASDVKSSVSPAPFKQNMRLDNLFIFSSQRCWCDIAWPSWRRRRCIEKNGSCRRVRFVSRTYHEHLPNEHLQLQSGFAQIAAMIPISAYSLVLQNAVLSLNCSLDSAVWQPTSPAANLHSSGSSAPSRALLYSTLHSTSSIQTIDSRVMKVGRRLFCLFHAAS